MPDEIVIATTTDSAASTAAAAAERPAPEPAEVVLESTSDGQAATEAALEGDETAARRPMRDHPSFENFRSWQSEDGKVRGLAFESPDSSRRDVERFLAEAEQEADAFRLLPLEEELEGKRMEPAADRVPARAPAPAIALLPSQLTDEQLDGAWKASQVLEEKNALEVEYIRRVEQKVENARQRAADRLAVLPQTEQADVHAAFDHLNSISPDLKTACLLPDNNLELAVHLSRHPQIVNSIMRMDVGAATKELRRIADSLLPAQGAPVSSRAAAPLPTPSRPIRGGTVRPNVPLEEMDYQAFKRQRERDIKNRYR